jgi:putative flippase GtrA
LTAIKILDNGNRMVFKPQIVKYGIVGIVSTLIHIGAASVFVRFFYESLIVSNSVGFLTAFIFSYVCQSKFVFDTNLTCKKALKFFLVQSVSLILAVKTTELMENFSIYLKILIVAFLLPLFAFFIHKLWTFGNLKKFHREEKNVQ